MRALRRTVSTAIACTAALSSCNAEVPTSRERAECRTPAACASMDALIAMSDLSSSGVGALGLSGEKSAYFGVDLGKDGQLSESNDRLFFIARDLDTVFEVSATCGEPLCRWSTRRAGHSGTTNPQDVAVAPDGTLWVPRYALPNIAILGAQGGEVATVPLPDLDGDGNPNASAIRIVDIAERAKAFVALELLDDKSSFRSRRPSALAVFDVASRTLERTIDLRGRNPFNAIVEHRGRFFFTESGNFDDASEADAGIERIDPKDPDVDRLFVSEVDLGGSPSAVAITDGCAAAIVSDATKVNATSVVTFDPESGAPIRTPQKGGALFGPSEDFHFWAITWAKGRLLVGDRRRGARGYPVHVFEPRSGGACDLAKRAEPLYVDQMPIAMRAKP